MVDVYVALIIRGRRTIDQVPANLQDAVLAVLNALGLDGYGKPLPSQQHNRLKMCSNALA